MNTTPTHFLTPAETLQEEELIHRIGQAKAEIVRLTAQVEEDRAKLMGLYAASNQATTLLNPDPQALEDHIQNAAHTYLKLVRFCGMAPMLAYIESEGIEVGSARPGNRVAAMLLKRDDVFRCEKEVWSLRG